LEQPAIEAVIENLNQKSSDDILNAVDDNDDEKKVADDARTVVTYVTEASTLVNQPLSYATATSSKLEL
jgi:NADPH-dependent ferric siderophore reductase